MHIEINACIEGTGIPLTSPSPAWLHLQTFIDFYPKIIYADFRTYEAQALTFRSTFRLTTVTITVTITITVIVLSFFSSLLCPPPHFATISRCSPILTDEAAIR